MQETQPAPAEHESNSIHSEVKHYYDDVLAPMARKYLFELPRHKGHLKEKPTVLVLGNHSSGKSAFINYVLGQEVQRTGLAPVDDGFTIITHAPEEAELDGPALVSHPEYPYSFLERFGPRLVSRVKMKARPVDLLEKVTLIDSPGMIDSLESSKSDRGYDFISVVRRLAESSDVVMLFFDPDKPGTTGETLTTLRESLSGMDHKLLVVMNKVDRFENMRDFARAYGALCWNLARTMHGKDLPHIYSTYVPVSEKQPESDAFPLADFDQSREDLVREVHNAPARRTQNMVSDLYKTARMLSTHVRICTRVARDLNLARLGYAALLALSVALALVLGLYVIPDVLAAMLTGVVIVGVTGAVSWFSFRRKNRLAPERLMEVFHQVYTLQLAERDDTERGDITTVWEDTRERTARALKALGPANVRLLFPGFRRVRKLDKAVQSQIPALRARVSQKEK